MKNFAVFAAMAAVVSAFASGCTENEKQIGIVAHRGYWNCEEAGYAKNSIASLKCAQDAGFWGSEFDLNMTADSVLIVYHDSKIEGKAIDQYPYETFKDIRLKNGEPIPTLDDYLEQANKKPETTLVFELKSRSSKELEDCMVDLSLAKLKEYGITSPDRVIFIAFSINVCERVAAAMPGFTVQYLDDDISPDELAAKGINGVDYNYKVYSKHPEWMEQAVRHGMKVNCWTVDEREDMKKMASIGVDYITTDVPEDARKVLAENGYSELTRLQ